MPEFKSEEELFIPILREHIYEGIDPLDANLVGLCACGTWFPATFGTRDDIDAWAEHVAQEIQQRGDVVPTWIARRIMWVFYAAGVATVVLVLLVLREFGL